MPASKKHKDKIEKGSVGVYGVDLGSELKLTNTQCPRCNNAFTCNAADIERCQCWGIKLTSKDLAYLGEMGFSTEEAGCLCRNCLLEIQNTVQKPCS